MADKSVNLVIRARDTASKAIEAAAAALAHLAENQGALGTSAKSTQGDLARLAKSIVDVERAYGSIGPAADRATASVEKQRAGLSATQQLLARTQQQAQAAFNAIRATQARIVDTVLAGGDTSRLITELKAAEAAETSLRGEAGRLLVTIERQKIALGQGTAALQSISAAANAAEAALAGVGAGANFDEQARAAEAFAASARSIGDSFRKAAAEQDAFLQQARAARGVMDIEDRTGVRAAPATANGATISALDEQARAAEAVAAAAREMGDAENAAALAAAKLRDRTDPLGAVQRKLNVELANARTLYRQNKISAEELARAEQFLTHEANEAANAIGRQGRGERGKPTLFGLKPYELTNLGYQVNDIATQLASGTSLTQTLAQQGGQLLQLFPKLGGAIVAALGNPIIIAGSVAIGGIAFSIKKAADEARRLREFEALITNIGAGAQLSARQLNEITRTLDRMGLSAQQAQAVVTALVREGLDPSRLQQFGVAARDAADTLGIDAAEAAQKLGEGLTGSYDSIVEMSSALGNILRPAELENIRLLYENGRASEARARAADVVIARLDRMATQSRGPWASATRSLSGAWDRFTQGLGDFVARSPGVQTQLSAWAVLLERIGSALDGIRDIGEIGADIADRATAIERLQNAIASSPQGSHQRALYEAALAQARQELATLRQEQARTRATGGGDPRDADSRRAEQERIDLARARTETMELQSLEEQYDRLIETDRRWGEVRDRANRIAIAGQIEYKRRLHETGSEQQANLARELAAARERARIGSEERQVTAQRESQARGNLLSTASRFVGRSENNPRDRNILMELFRAGGQNVDPRIVAWCAAFVNAVLAANGLRGTGSNMARSFENFGEAVTNPQAGDIAVFRRNGPTGREGHVGFFSRFDANGNPVIVSGNSGDQVTEQAYNRRDLIGYRRATVGTNGGMPSTFDAQRVEAQASFNDQLDREADNRRRSTEEMQRQLGLSGEQLLAEQRRQAIADAIHDAEVQATQQNLTLDDTRRRSIEQTTGALFDLQNAQRRATEGVDAASAERQALLDRLDAARQIGDNDLVAEIERQLSGVDNALESAINRAIEFWRQFNTPEARTAITGLQALREGIGRTRDDLTLARVQQPIDQLQARRDSLRQGVDFFRDRGQMSNAAELSAQLQQVDADLIQAIDDAIAFWSVSTRPEAAATLQQLQNLRGEVVAARNEFAITAGEIQQAFAGDIVNAVDFFAQRVAEGRNVFESLGLAAAKFAGDFLRDLAMMILKAAALKLALKLGFGGLAGGMTDLVSAAPLAAAGGAVAAGGGAVAAGATALGVSAASLMAAAQMLIAANSIGSAGIFHGGGVAGAATRTRSVWPGVFAGAARYHTGGIAGLKPGEVPAILERGERILSKSQVREQLRAGASAGSPEPSLTRVVAIFREEELAAALQSRSGERVVMAHVRRNLPEIAKSVSDNNR